MALNKIHYDIGGNRAACGTFSYRNHDMYPLNDFLDSESPAKCKRCAVMALDAAIKLDSEMPARLAPDKSRISDSEVENPFDGANRHPKNRHRGF